MRIIVEWSGHEPQTVICDGILSLVHNCVINLKILDTDTIAEVKKKLEDQGTPLPGGNTLLHVV